MLLKLGDSGLKWSVLELNMYIMEEVSKNVKWQVVDNFPNSASSFPSEILIFFKSN